ncbi:MAG: type II secretion system minor pseudopilin GspK [Coxiellaceae bacterium]|nr:MAG: type II secretion system minor pseudopilin GspK [Coxiellaceae bacterium]
MNDLQSRFNLNSLINPAAYAKFIHLLQAVAPEVSAKQAEQIAVALNEWLLPISGTSANDESYARHRPPYRAAHRFMTSISELRLVAGVTPIIYQRLLPYVAAYPDSDTAAINVNTASLPVLLTLSPSMTVAEAEEIIARRKQQPFTDTRNFLALPAIAKYNITGDDVVVTSTFFMVVATVAQGQQSLTMYTLLQRLVMAQTIQAKIIWQTQNTE